jgi:hypothetical protein
MHHGALEFPGGQIVQLTRLCGGQSVRAAITGRAELPNMLSLQTVELCRNPGHNSPFHGERVELRKFTELQTSHPVAINACLVRCIRPADTEGHALVEFGDDHVVAVTADVDGAVSMLTIA